jgi:hypothetical protein
VNTFHEITLWGLFKISENSLKNDPFHVRDLYFLNTFQIKIFSHFSSLHGLGYLTHVQASKSSFTPPIISLSVRPDGVE